MTGTHQPASAEAARYEDRDVMRGAVLDALRKQGFTLDGGRIVPPEMHSKKALRDLHRDAVEHQRSRSRSGLERHESRLIESLASGTEVKPRDIAPRLVKVEAGTHDELLFRWARLHWSIPTSAGYGRRLRFLVIDDANGRLMGIIGLSDPVYALGSRDRWIGWDTDAHRKNLNQVMDAFVLGAIPPYNDLLGGKLVAMLVTSSEVQKAYWDLYGSRPSRMSGVTNDRPLALVTTASALGRSSVYNRVRYHHREICIGVGYTLGSGDFQFANGLYDDLKAYSLLHCEPTAKRSSWGNGFRNRREVVKKALEHLGLGDAFLYHGVKREVFAFPMGSNTQKALTGRESLAPYTADVAALADFWHARWLEPRAARTERWKTFDSESWRLW